jgi:hypothetical protein
MTEIERDIRSEIVKAFGWLDAPPELLDTVTEAAKKQLSRAATEIGCDRDLTYILDSWADETKSEHDVLASLQAWNRSAAERALHDVQQGRAPLKAPAKSFPTN